MEQSWPVSSQPVYGRTMKMTSLSPGLGFPETSQHQSGSYSFWIFWFVWISRWKWYPVFLILITKTAWTSAMGCFQETQHWWLHLCPAINSNRPVSRINYNQLFNRKNYVSVQRKQLFYCLFLFQTRCNNISSMTEVVAYWKTESS